MKRILSAAALTCLAFAALSFNIEGDLRWSAFNRTLRHWQFVEAVHLVKPACAAGFLRSGGGPCGGAGSYTLTGPTSGGINAASTFTVQPNGISTATITPSDSSHGGVFSPTSLSFSGSSSPQTFTYTPLQAGSWSISTTNTGSLTNPGPVSFSVANLVSGYPSFSSPWIVVNGTFTTGLAGDPFGAANATKIIEDGTLNLHDAQSGTFAVTSGNTYNAFLMMKSGSGDRTLAVFLTALGGSSGVIMYIDPATCTINAAPSGAFGGSTLVSSATRTANLGTGWCLLQFAEIVNYTTGVLSIYLVSAGNQSYAGNGASFNYIYGGVTQ